MVSTSMGSSDGYDEDFRIEVFNRMIDGYVTRSNAVSRVVEFGKVCALFQKSNGNPDPKLLLKFDVKALSVGYRLYRYQMEKTK